MTVTAQDDAVESFWRGVLRVEDEPLLSVVPALSVAADETGALLSAARTRFRLYDRDALDHLPPPDPLIGGLLPAKGLALLAGSRGLGKTLLAMGITATISSDLPTWVGLDVARHGPVLYCSLEGFHGIPNRVRAWEAWQQRRADGITWLRDPIDLKRGTDARMLGLLAQDLGAVAVVIDSARATGAGAEDTADMGEFVRGLETVQQVTDALVMVLHNTGWNETRERGSTLLPDACDTTLLLEGDPAGLRGLRHRKHRDGEMLPDPLTFTFRPIEGTGSGVLVPATAPPGPPTLRDLLLTAVTNDPGKSTGHYADALNRPRQSTSKALAALDAMRLIRNTGPDANHPAWQPAAGDNA